MLISLTFWCFFGTPQKSKNLSRLANNEIIDRQGRKFLQRGIFDIFLHSPVLTTFLTFFDFFDKIQKLEGWVLYSNGQISVTNLFYFMTGPVKKFRGSIKDLYKKFKGEDKIYWSFKISDIKKLLGVGENLKWEMTKC
jgi:hypothetical protein